MSSLPSRESDFKIAIPIIGPSYAGGGGVYTDDIVDWREIAVPSGCSAGQAFFCSPVVGDSLSGLDIEVGDWLISRACKVAYPGDLVIAWCPNGRCAKFLFRNPANPKVAILRSANPEYQDWQFEYEDINVVGIVRRVERDILLNGQMVIETVCEFEEHKPAWRF